jgi:subtilase family serine protease
VRFTLENCGDTASQTPFVTDIYINGTRADTIEIPNAIQPHSAMGIVSSLANLASTGSCNSASVRVVVDSQNKVQDSNPANNDQTAQITPPCPDLAVTSIWRHWLDDLHTQFEIRYTVANLGNAPIPHPVRIHGWGVPSPGIPPDLPVNYEEMLNSLSPGESRDFQIHQAFWKGDSVELKIAVDADDTIAEPNKTNNLMSGTY